MVSVLFYLMTAGLCCCHRRDQPSSGHCHIVTRSLPTPAQPPPRHLDTFLATPEGRTFMHRNKLLLLNRLSALTIPCTICPCPLSAVRPVTPQWAGRCWPPCPPLPTIGQTHNTQQKLRSPQFIIVLLLAPCCCAAWSRKHLVLQTIHRFSQSQRHG